MIKDLPRGYRNFNPGNIDRTSERWQGMAEDQSGDSRFIVFQGPEWGIRCIMRLLVTYQDRHNLYTIRGILHRWAPPNGRNPATGQPYTQNTDAYIKHVSDLTGFDPDQQLDLFDRDTNLAITKAIIRHELGDPAKHGKPAHWYGDATYDKAMALAGFEPDRNHIKDSRTIAGSILAGGGAVVGAIYDSLGETVAGAAEATGSLGFLPDNWKHWLFTGIILLGVGRVIYARLDDEKRRVS